MMKTNIKAAKGDVCLLAPALSSSKRSLQSSFFHNCFALNFLNHHRFVTWCYGFTCMIDAENSSITSWHVPLIAIHLLQQVIHNTPVFKRFGNLWWCLGYILNTFRVLAFLNAKVASFIKSSLDIIAWKSCSEFEG